MLGIESATPDAPVSCNCKWDEGHEPACNIVAAHNYLTRAGKSRFTKEGLLSYFQQFLDGERGLASAEVLADLCLNVQYETEKRLRTWRPINTAPKDGTNFLACSSASSVFFAHWANGVVDSSNWSDERGYAARYATHWMPLPVPIETPAESAGTALESAESHD
jgi:hypothetical protein